MKTLVCYKDLSQLGISYTRQHIISLTKRGLFPPGIRMSSRRIVWDLAEIQEWLSTRPRVAYTPPPDPSLEAPPA